MCFSVFQCYFVFFGVFLVFCLGLETFFGVFVQVMFLFFPCFLLSLVLPSSFLDDVLGDLFVLERK